MVPGRTRTRGTHTSIPRHTKGLHWVPPQPPLTRLPLSRRAPMHPTQSELVFQKPLFPRRRLLDSHTVIPGMSCHSKYTATLPQPRLSRQARRLPSTLPRRLSQSHPWDGRHRSILKPSFTTHVPPTLLLPLLVPKAHIQVATGRDLMFHTTHHETLVRHAAMQTITLKFLTCTPLPARLMQAQTALPLLTSLDELIVSDDAK